MTAPRRLDSGGMTALLGEFRSFRARQRTGRLAGMTGLMQAISTRRARLVQFNTVAVCGVGTDEVRHSSILAWFLDARKGHGQGALFLDAFMQASGISPIPDLVPCTVRTEFQFCEAAVDILVYKPNEFALYIENKVLAAEGDRQVDRELRDLRKLGRSLQIPEAKQFAVFLSPEGRRPTSGDPAPWRSLSYYDLTAAFHGVLPRISDVKVRGFVADWIDAVQSWRVTDAIL